MPILSHLHQLFNAEHVKPTSIGCGGKIVRGNVPGARATILDRGALTTIGQG